MNIDALLEELSDLVAAKVLAKLGTSTTHYGTRKGATLPPGKSRAWALRTLKTIPGAKKVGRDYVVSVEDFDAWATERDDARTRKSHVDLRHANDARQDVEALAEASLSASGFRRARTSTR